MRYLRKSRRVKSLMVAAGGARTGSKKQHLRRLFTCFVFTASPMGMLISASEINFKKNQFLTTWVIICTYRACWLGWYGLTELFANFAKFEQKESQFVHLQGWKTETEFRDDFCLQLRTYPESDRGLVLSWVSGRQRKDSLLWLDLSISPGLIFFSSELLVGESELLSARGPLLLKREIKISLKRRHRALLVLP